MCNRMFFVGNRHAQTEFSPERKIRLHGAPQIAGEQLSLRGNIKLPPGLAQGFGLEPGAHQDGGVHLLPAVGRVVGPRLVSSDDRRPAAGRACPEAAHGFGTGRRTQGHDSRPQRAGAGAQCGSPLRLCPPSGNHGFSGGSRCFGPAAGAGCAGATHGTCADKEAFCLAQTQGGRLYRRGRAQDRSCRYWPEQGIRPFLSFQTSGRAIAGLCGRGRQGSGRG